MFKQYYQIPRLRRIDWNKENIETGIVKKYKFRKYVRFGNTCIQSARNDPSTMTDILL